MNSQTLWKLEPCFKPLFDVFQPAADLSLPPRGDVAVSLTNGAADLSPPPKGDVAVSLSNGNVSVDRAVQEAAVLANGPVPALSAEPVAVRNTTFQSSSPEPTAFLEVSKMTVGSHTQGVESAQSSSEPSSSYVDHFPKTKGQRNPV